MIATRARGTVLTAWAWLAAVRLALAAPQIVATYSLGGPEYGIVNPQAAAFDRSRGELWIAGNGLQSGLLVVLDAATKKTVAAVPVPLGSFSSLAADPARGRVYYSASSSNLQVIETATRKVSSWSLSGCFSRAITLDEATGDVYLFCDVYIPNIGTRQKLMRLDSTGALKAQYQMPTHTSFYARALRVGAGRVYLPVSAYTAPNPWRGELWVFDKSSLALAQNLPLAALPNGSAFDPADGTLYLADSYSRLLALKPNAEGNMIVVSITTGLLYARELLFNPTTRRLYVGSSYSGKIYVVDAPTKQWVKTISLSAASFAWEIDPAGGRLYAIDKALSAASLFDLKTETLQETLDLRLRSAFDIAWDTGTPRAWVTSAMTGGGIHAWDRSLGQPTQFLPEPQALTAAYLPTLGKLYFNTSNGVRWRSPAGAASTNVPALNYSVGLARMEGSSLLLASLSHGAGAEDNRSQLAIYDPAAEMLLRQLTIGYSSAAPRAAAFNPVTGKAYVPLLVGQQLAVVDVAQGLLLKTVNLGYTAAAKPDPELQGVVAVDSNLNRIFVSHFDRLLVIDGQTDSVAATLYPGAALRSVAVKRKGQRVYVADAGGSLKVLNGATLKEVASLSLGGTPRMIRVDESSERVYVTLLEGARIVVIEDPHTPESAPPVVTHAPIAGPVADSKAVNVSASVTDDRAVAAVTLTYWDAVWGGGYYTVAMKNVSGSLYEGQIPAAFLGAIKGVKVAYFIDATDEEGNGPPTGSTPGSALAPNQFELKRLFTPVWNFAFGDIYGGFYRMTPGPSAAIGDIRPGMTGLEIATGNEEYIPLGGFAPRGRWFLFDKAGSVLFWKDTTNDEAHSSVNLFDIDGDSVPEMFGGTTSGNQLQAWDSNAAFRWRHILGGHHLATPAVDLLSPGQTPTVFSASFDGYVRAIDAKTGQLKWSFNTFKWIWSSPSVADLDGDGKKEVVVGADDGNLYALDSLTPTLKWKVSLASGNSPFVRASPAIADLDGDGAQELLIGAPNGLFRCIDGRNGNILWSFATGGEIVSSAAVGDLDGDGKLEVVFGSGDGSVYALNRDGTLKWKAPLGSAVYSSPALARRNPGKVLDVYAVAFAGRLAALRGSDGALLGNFHVGATVVSSPVVGDVDGDGRLEVFFQDRKGDQNSPWRGDVFWAIRDLESSVAPYAREWPMFRSDPAHTGVYHAATTIVAPPADPPPAQVTGLSLQAAAEGQKLIASWSAVLDADLLRYRVYRDGQFVAFSQATSYTDSGLTNGTTYSYQVSAVDKAGHEGPQSEPASGTPGDQIKPVSLILSPASGGFRAGTVTVSGSAADTGSGLSQVRIHATDNSLGTTAIYHASGTLSWTISLGASSWLDGHHYAIRSQAVDAAGNAELPQSSVTFTYDGAPPTGHLMIGQGSPWITHATATLHISAQDPVSGMAGGQMRFSSDGVSWSGVELFAQSKAWEFSPGEGPKTVYATVSDAVGNWSPPFHASVGVDLAAPKVAILKPKANETVELLSEVTGTASDTGSGLDQVSIRILEGASNIVLDWSLVSATHSWRWEGPLSLTRASAYTVSARAFDKAGRVSDPTQTSFEIARLAKVSGLALEAPPEGQRLRLSWNPNPENDVAGYRVYRNAQFHSLVSTSSMLDAGLADGATYTYTVSAVDTQGVEGTVSDPISGVPRDRLAPVSRIVWPAAGARLAALSIPISGTAVDPGAAGLERIEVGIAESGAASFSWSLAIGTGNFTAALLGVDGRSYQLASRARDREGNMEAQPAVISVTIDLIPGPVSGLKATPETNSAMLAWDALPAPDLSVYRVYGPHGKLAGQTKSTSFELSGLVAGTAYTCSVSAVDAEGQEGPKTALPFTTVALGKARAWIRVPTQGKRLWGNAVTILSDTEGPVAKVLFQFRPENQLGWTDITASDAKPPYAVYWNISDANASPGPYRLRAVAYDTSGLADYKPAEIGVILDDANAEIVEDGNPDVDPNTPHRKLERISSTQTVEVALADGTSVLIPPGVVGEGETLQLKVVPPAAAPKPVSRELALAPAGIFREFKFVSGLGEFKQELIVTLPVPDENGDGLVDGTQIPVSNLRVYYFSEKLGLWLPVESNKGKPQMSALAAGSGSPAIGTDAATFRVSHFTLFGLFAETSVSPEVIFNEVYAFPNPAAAGQSPTFHVEAGRVEKMELRVYDLSGELVHSGAIDSPPVVIDGKYAYRLRWDAARAASGVYLYIINVYNAAGQKFTSSGKLALVR